MSRANNFLDKLSEKLSAEGYSVKRNLWSDPYQFDLIAAKSAFELAKFGKMTRFIIASEFNPKDARTVEDFSSASTKYALDNRGSLLPRGLGGSLLCVPAIVSDTINDGLRDWITQTSVQKHWSAFEFPVLISPGEKKVYYSKKTPIWGAAYYKGFREYVEQEFRLD